MAGRLTLAVPGGGDLEVEVQRRAAGRATLVVARADWPRVVDGGLLHVDAARANAPLDRIPSEGPVEVDAVLAPGGDESSTDGWWALHATAAVELPPDLAATGSLAEGVSFAEPSDVAMAWDRARSAFDEDGADG
ncbi:MAG TPA: hypothetical protein VM618_01675 [Acidimicrobiia bacterium]|nr:hypothetical protein [Acidimicrobiia bacterium]